MSADEANSAPTVEASDCPVAPPSSLSSDEELADRPALSRRQGKKRGIPYPENGKCHLCRDNPAVAKTNWSRHLKLKHPAKLAEAESSTPSDQTTLDKHVVDKQKPNRLFALYAATSTFPVNHLNNKYLQVRALLRQLVQSSILGVFVEAQQLQDAVSPHTRLSDGERKVHSASTAGGEDQFFQV